MYIYYNVKNTRKYKRLSEAIREPNPNRVPLTRGVGLGRRAPHYPRTTLPAGAGVGQCLARGAPAAAPPAQNVCFNLS